MVVIGRRVGFSVGIIGYGCVVLRLSIVVINGLGLLIDVIVLVIVFYVVIIVIGLVVVIEYVELFIGCVIWWFFCSICFNGNIIFFVNFR